MHGSRQYQIDKNKNAFKKQIATVWSADQITFTCLGDFTYL
jgi:hypothetical protein